MTLSEYIKLLKPLQIEGAVGDFLYELFDHFVRLPTKAEKMAEAAGGEKFSPIRRTYTSSESLRKIANNNSNMKPACAAELCSLYDEDRFVGFMIDRRDDTDFIREGLLAAGFSTILPDGDDDHLVIAARLLHAILTNITKGITDTKPPLQPYLVKSIHEDAFKQAHVENNILTIGTYQIKLPFSTNDIRSENEKDLPYVVSLLEAYSKRMKVEYKSIDDLKERPELWHHFQMQQKSYFTAEAMSRSVRDLFADAEVHLKLLKDEIYNAITPVYYDLDIHDGITRLKEVLKLAETAQLNSTILLNIKGLIDIEAKKGICHILIKDKYITSWVEVNYDEPI